MSGRNKTNANYLYFSFSKHCYLYLCFEQNFSNRGSSETRYHRLSSHLQRIRISNIFYSTNSSLILIITNICRGKFRVICEIFEYGVNEIIFRLKGLRKPISGYSDYLVTLRWKIRYTVAQEISLRILGNGNVERYSSELYLKLSFSFDECINLLCSIYTNLIRSYLDPHFCLFVVFTISYSSATRPRLE